MRGVFKNQLSFTAIMRGGALRYISLNEKMSLRMVDIIFCLLIGVVCFIYYAPSLVTSFYTDDPIWIYRGKQVLTTGEVGFYPFYYRPVPIIGFALQYAFFGSHYVFYHATNIVLLIIGTCLFFVLTTFFFKQRMTSYLLTLLSVLWPVNFDKVNWICNQTYLWEIIFYISTVIFFIASHKRRSVPSLLCFNLAFAGALWSNEIGVTLVPLLFAIYLFLRRENMPLRGGGGLVWYCWGCVFFWFSLYGFVYVKWVYPRYLYFQSLSQTQPFSFSSLIMTVRGVFDFLAVKLGYIVFLLPGGGLLHHYDASGYILLGILFFVLVANSGKPRLFVIWSILSVLLGYFSPHKNHLMASHVMVSVTGAWLLLGYGMDKLLMYGENKRPCAREIVQVGCIAFCIVTGLYYVSMLKDWRHHRQGRLYQYYSQVVEKKFDHVTDYLNVYFVDGSPFISLNEHNDFNAGKRCLKSGLDFEYLSFLYHLKLYYNTEQIRGFAISQADVATVKDTSRSVFLYIND